MNQIDDNYIINKYWPNRCKIKLYSKIEKDEFNYVINRFNDSDNFEENIYRIKNKIEKIPTCKICNKKLKYLSSPYRRYQLNYCSSKCKNNDKEIIKKQKQTLFKHYNTYNLRDLDQWKKSMDILLENGKYINISQIPKINKKIKNSWNNRSDDENLEKNHKEFNTNLKKYGSINNIKKSKITNLNKYGEDHWTKTEEGKSKMSEITLKQETQMKMHLSRVKNNTSKISKFEEKANKIISKYFKKDIDYIWHFRDEKRYPFEADFYLIKQDIFIEIQGYISHGKKPYNENDKECLDLVNKWKTQENKNIKLYGKSKYSEYLKTYLIYDVNKRNIAKKNNINLKEFWKLEDLDNYIKNIK